MKTRIRTLSNGKHIVEASRFGYYWRAVMIDKSKTTKLAMEQPNMVEFVAVPQICYMDPSNSNYSLTWHINKAAAENTLKTFLSLLGK
jgi:hypothetical protein